MLDFETSSKKFEKEQKMRMERQKLLQLEKLRKDQEYTKMQKALIDRIEQKKIEEEELSKLKELQAQEEFRLTGGIKFEQTLVPYEIEGEDDKVILPEACLGDLELQGAIGGNQSVLTFRIQNKTNFGHTFVTHCGVKEFTGEKGLIGLPSKVIESLTNDSFKLETITIKYVKMSKCKYVKLQPQLNKFFDVLPVKACLEENLTHHTTLSVGDQITVWYRGTPHPLKVVEMKPESHGLLIDTDLEVDLDLSQEYLQSQEAKHNISQTDPVDPMDTNTTKKMKAIEGHVLGSTSTNNSQQYPPITLPLDIPILPEPTGSIPNVALKLKAPNGMTLVRKFGHEWPLLQLFLYLSNELNVDMYKIQVSSRGPSRITLKPSDCQDDAHRTFKDCGLGIQNESMFVTVI